MSDFYHSQECIPVIIPAYEPDANLLMLCEQLKKANIEIVIIIDDGSGANYRYIFDEIEKIYHYSILRHAVNLGKGRALKSAFNFVLNEYPNAKGVVTADSDGQHAPKDIIRCMEGLIDYPENLILGCRDFSGNTIPWKSKFGNKITRKLCGFLCGIKVSDTQTGLRGIPQEFMKILLSVLGERFEYETNMLIASQNKVHITEIPIQTVYESKENHKTHFDPILDSVRVYKILGIVFLKYIISSFSSSVIDILLFSFFSTHLYLDKEEIYIVVATILARIASSIYNYMINNKFVFHSSKKPGKTFWEYVVLAVCIMCASAFFVSLFAKLLPVFPVIIIKVIVDTILFLVSYKIQQSKIF